MTKLHGQWRWSMGIVALIFGACALAQSSKDFLKDLQVQKFETLPKHRESTQMPSQAAVNASSSGFSTPLLLEKQSLAMLELQSRIDKLEARLARLEKGGK